MTRRPVGAARWSPAALLCVPLALVLGALLGAPALALLRESVRGEDGGLTAAHYAAVVTHPTYRRALLTSLLLSLVVAAGSTALCLAPAWLLARRRFRGRRALRMTLALPMAFSGVVVGFLFVMLLGRAGAVPKLAERLTGEPWLQGSAYGPLGLALAYLYFEVPRATLTLEGALRRFDARLEDAAKTLGANRWQRLVHVVLPAIRPALLSTFAVTFSASLGSFGVVLILSTRHLTVLPLEVFRRYDALDFAGAAAMSVVLMALALATNLGARALVRRWEVGVG